MIEYQCVSCGEMFEDGPRRVEDGPPVCDVCTESDTCYYCEKHMDGDEETMTITVDLDPGDPEVGPDPCIQEVTVHKDCHESHVQAQYEKFYEI